MNTNAMLRLITLAVVSCLLSQSCFAQLPAKGIVGSFYVSVDDAAKIFVDGKAVHDAGFNESRSGELELSVGQRIVVQLRDDGGGRRFMLAFVSADRQTVISFRHRDFKIVPELNVTDFTPEEFKKWTKFSKGEKYEEHLPVKNYSEWVWGGLNNCIIACTVTPEMIRKMPL